MVLGVGSMVWVQVGWFRGGQDGLEADRTVLGMGRVVLGVGRVFLGASGLSRGKG